MVRLLLARGANLTLLDSSRLASLNLACTEEVPEIVSMLVQAGADPNGTTFMGHTPLMAAAMEGRVRVARALLGFGARTDARDHAGLTALNWARRERHAEVVSLLGG